MKCLTGKLKGSRINFSVDHHHSFFNFKIHLKFFTVRALLKTIYEKKKLIPEVKILPAGVFSCLYYLYSINAILMKYKATMVVQRSNQL